MRYELRKILTNRYALLLMICAVLANGFLFYRHCTSNSAGYTLQQVRQKYDVSLEDLEAENAELSQRISTALNGRDDTLLTGDLSREITLNHEIINRRAAAETYLQQIQGLQEEAALKRTMGFFNDPFSGRILQKTEEIYHALETVQPEVSFSGATEPLSDWIVSDLFVLLFGFLPGLLLMTQERRAGLSCLLQPTKYGHGRLFFRKFGAMSLLLLTGFVMIYGVNFLIAGCLLGFGSLGRAIQSVYGFEACPLALSVGGYLLLLEGSRLLWCWCVSALFFLLCTASSRAALVLVCFAALFGASVWMAGSGSLWLRALSLRYTIDMPGLLQGCIFLNFFGIPVPVYLAALAVMATVLLSSVALSCLVFCKQPAAVRAGTRRLRFPGLHRTSLFAQEGWKLLALHGGLAALVLFGAVQFAQYQDFYIRNDSWEYFYRTDSQQLSGEPSPEKEQWLADEEVRFEALKEQLAQTKDLTLQEELSRQLFPEDAFRFAAAQYRALEPGQSYVYASGYERLYRAEGIHDDLVNTAMLLFVLCIVFSGVFSVEKESGVLALQVSAGKQRASACWKRLHATVFVLLVMLIAYLPQYLAVASGYGLPELTAAANSLSIFSTLPDCISLRGLLLLTALVRVCVCQFAGHMILLLSKKIGNTIVAMLVSVACFLFPVLLAIIL